MATDDLLEIALSPLTIGVIGDFGTIDGPQVLDDEISPYNKCQGAVKGTDFLSAYHNIASRV